jgi:cell division protein ZapA (FtsZ GTPase activity inhibitor)
LNTPPERTVVRVEIAGEEYNIRALASPEYTKDCAAYVDRTLSEIMRQGALVQPHKGAILAALALADELFQTRARLDELRDEITRRAEALTSAIDAALDPADLAGGL